ncbi:MAG: transcriptional regulator [Myxococcales bacterium]|nr:MAG: transcriptional regulator [Myxococcales bacterium]
MAKRPNNCGIGPAFEVIGGKWKAVILWELNAGPQRFGALRRRVGAVSEKMLVQQLRELEDDGLVTRTVFAEVPPRVEYAATALGLGLNVALGPLADWGERYERSAAGRRAAKARREARALT